MKAMNKMFATLAAALTSVTGGALALIGMPGDSPPHAIEASSNCEDLSIVHVRFDKILNPITAEDSFNYMIGGLTIVMITLQPDQQTAELRLDSPLTPNVTYDLTLNDITDLAGNALYPNPTRLTFTAAAGPRLSITRDDMCVDISWPASSTEFTLQQNLTAVTNGWSNVTNTVIVISSENHVKISPIEGNRFFRLIRPCPVPP